MSYQHEALISPDVCTLRFATTPSFACDTDSQIMFAKAVGTKNVLYQRAADTPGIGERNAAARRSFEVSMTWHSTQGANQFLGPLSIKGCLIKEGSGAEIGHIVLYCSIPIVSVGKESSSMVTCKMTAPVTGTALKTTGPLPPESRQRTPSVRNCVTR